MKELFAKRNGLLRKNGLIAVIIFIFFGLLAASFVAVGLLTYLLVALTIPLFILPLSFSFQRAVIILRDNNETLTFKMIIEGYRLYFSERFMSTFSFFKTILWSILVYIATTIIVDLTVNLSFYFTNYMGYQEFFHGLVEALESLNTETIYQYIQTHADILTVVELYVGLPPLAILSLFFLTSFSISGTSLFLRFSSLKYPGNYLALIHTSMIKANRKKFYGRYLALNWPLYILFIGGLALGGYLGSFYQISVSSIFTFGLMMGLFLSLGLYGAVYIANKEALYNSLIDDYKEIDSKMRDDLQKNISAQIEAMLKEQDSLKELEDNEENKNDSNESQ